MPGDVVLITGCSTGIGHALAAELQRRGARVFASARRPDALRELRALGCETLALDVTDPCSVRAAVATVLAAAGRIDVLVNNAGVVMLGPTAEVPLAEVQRAFATNVLGLLDCCQAVVPHMAAQGSGRIVNIASLTGFTPVPLRGIYSATKAAVMRLSDALRVECSGLGIQVMVVAPGFIQSSARDTAKAAALSYAQPAASLWPGWLLVLEAAMTKLLAGAVDTAAYASRLVDVASRRQMPRYWVGPCAGLEWLLRWLPLALQDSLSAKAMGLRQIPAPGAAATSAAATQGSASAAGKKAS